MIFFQVYIYIENNSGEEMLTEALCTFLEEHVLNR